MKNQVKITVGGKEITLRTKLFNIEEDELDVDKILFIDYQNIDREVMTFPIIMNRIGMLMAETENELLNVDANYRVFCAKESKKIRQELEENKKRPTNDKVEEILRSTNLYLIHLRKRAKATYNRDLMNSIYWSAKSKDDKLNSIVNSSPMEFRELSASSIEGEFNGVTIKFN